MGDEWRQSTLSEISSQDGNGIVDGPFGSNLPASSYTEYGTPVIRGGNLTLGLRRFIADRFVFVSEETAQRLSRSLCKPSDIVFTKKGTLGQTGFIPNGGYGKYLISSNQMKLTVNSAIADPLYVYYYVSSPASVAKVLRDSESTGVPKTNLTYLKSFPITLPSLQEQRAIAHILGSIDDKIELNLHMNTTLKAMAQTLFKSWFVYFDPVIDNALAVGNPIPEPLHARSETRKTLGDKRKPLPEAIQKQFPNRFVFSEEMGWTPAGWDVSSFDGVCDVRKGLSYKGKHLTDDGSAIPMMNLGNFGGGGKFRAEKIKYYEGDYKENHLVKAGQLMIANTDMTQDRIVLGSPIVVPSFTSEEIIFTHHTFAVDFRENYPEPLWKPYLYFVSLEPEFRRRAEGFATGTTVLALPKDALLKCSVILPNFQLVEKFSSEATSFFARQECFSRQNAQLSVLRDTLLPKLLSGQLRIPDAEKLLVDAV